MSKEYYYLRQDLESLFQISRATIYRWVKEGSFPKPIHLGANMVRWKVSDIEEWIVAREATNLGGDSNAQS
jgi:prophage regulatory protein